MLLCCKQTSFQINQYSGSIKSYLFPCPSLTCLSVLSGQPLFPQILMSCKYGTCQNFCFCFRVKAYVHNCCKLELVTGEKKFKYKSISGRYKYKSECKSYTHVRCCMFKKKKVYLILLINKFFLLLFFKASLAFIKSRIKNGYKNSYL